MKPVFLKVVPISLALISIFFAGCGSKKGNVVNSNPPAGSTSLFNGANPQFGSTYTSLKATIGCLSGRARLSADYVFSMANASASQSTLYGQFQPNPITGGTAAEMFVGISAFRDLMFLTKVTNGSGAVLGYNVVLSMCSLPNGTYPALISNERTLTNFQAPNGITMNSTTGCGYGLIAAAYNTFMVSNRLPNNPYTFDFNVYTTFSNQGCIK